MGGNWCRNILLGEELGCSYFVIEVEDKVQLLKTLVNMHSHKINKLL